MNTTTPHDASSAPPSNDSIVDALFDVGTAWAEQGLVIGRLALETSAATLNQTAKLLDRVRAAIARNAAAANEPADAAK